MGVCLCNGIDNKQFSFNKRTYGLINGRSLILFTILTLTPPPPPVNGIKYSVAEVDFEIKTTSKKIKKTSNLNQKLWKFMADETSEWQNF